jgi:hypothetical protein
MFALVLLIYVLHFSSAFQSQCRLTPSRAVIMWTPLCSDNTGMTRPVANRLATMGQKGDDDRVARSDRIGGTGTEGKALLILGFLLSAWFFTVPPEFRRTRICSVSETQQFPEVCMTADQFVDRVAEYYKSGGGIQWDFSVGSATKEYFDR